MLLRSLAIKIICQVATCAALCAMCSACAESSFLLQEDSRLPRWFQSEADRRDEVTVEVLFYGIPGGRGATLILRDRSGRRLHSVDAKVDGLAPQTLGHAADGPFSVQYEVLRAEGITEVLEFKNPDDRFRITDDESTLREVGARR